MLAAVPPQPVPVAAHSWYLGDLDPGRLRAVGVADATAAAGLPRAVVVLDAGDPDTAPGSTQLPAGLGLGSARQPQAAFTAYAAGFRAAPGAPPLVLVLATSTFGGHVDAAHGTGWAAVVSAVAAASPGADVRGGVDAEPAYGPASAALSFVRAYVAAGGPAIVDLGDCPCAPGQALPQGWSLTDRADLATAGSVLPEQYRSSGIDAMRWGYLDARVRAVRHRPLDVLGVLTQTRACASTVARVEECRAARTAQQPAVALAGLSAALGRPVTAATDVGYLVPPAPHPRSWHGLALGLGVGLPAALLLAAAGLLLRRRRRVRAAS